MFQCCVEFPSLHEVKKKRILPSKHIRDGTKSSSPVFGRETCQFYCVHGSCPLRRKPKDTRMMVT